jgi:hypothetical protein
LVWVSSLFVGPLDGSVGSFGRCRVSSSERIMFAWPAAKLERKGDEDGDGEGIMGDANLYNGNYAVRSRLATVHPATMAEPRTVS